ncbi:hypothetical protein [Nostoc sp. UHCC 0302]
MSLHNPEGCNTNSINDCNTYFGEDAIHRVSTDGLFVTFFF